MTRRGSLRLRHPRRPQPLRLTRRQR